jgi:hypothetical protein
MSRLCSATFEQRLAFIATFCNSSNFKQLLLLTGMTARFYQNVGQLHKSTSCSPKTEFYPILAAAMNAGASLQTHNKNWRAVVIVCVGGA